MESLSDILKREATEHHACKKALRAWPEDGDTQKLIDLWKANLDFAIESGFPATDSIKANFDPELLHANLIFVDEDIDLKDAPSGIYVLNGGCSGTIRFGQWAAATVYVRHSSNVVILAGDFSKVFVRLYDEAEADILGMDEAVVKVYDRR